MIYLISPSGKCTLNAITRQSLLYTHVTATSVNEITKVIVILHTCYLTKVITLNAKFLGNRHFTHMLQPTWTTIFTLHGNTKEIVILHTCYRQIGIKFVTLNANTKEIVTLHTVHGQNSWTKIGT